MKKTYFICCFLLLMVPLVHGQKNAYDSLEQLLRTEKVDTAKLALLNQLVNLAFGSDLNKALAYAKQGVKLAEKTGDKNWQPRFWELAGRMHANLLHLDTAATLFDRALAGYLATGDKKRQATTLFKIGWVHRKRDGTEKALVADLKALSLMEAIGDQKGMASAYERISADLIRQNRLAEATGYAKKAIAICEKNNYADELVYALTNAGDVCMHSRDHEQALGYFNRVLELSRLQPTDASTICDFTNNRGNALKRLGRYKAALADYQTVLALAKKVNYPNAIAATIANLGEVSLLLGDYQAALGYQLETVKKQEKDSDLSNLTENYHHVSTIYEKLGDYPSALKYHKKAYVIRDSLRSTKSDEAMSKMLVQYETKAKEATILSQTQQLAQQQQVQWLGIGLVILLAGFLLFGYISYRARTKTNRLLATKNAENELLLKEIHHRVKNNLEVVSSLLALQSAQIDDPFTKDAMLEGQNRVHSIGIVHQKLYQGENLGAVEMKDYFINLSDSILSSFGAQKRVEIQCAMEKLDVDVDTAVPLGLIVNELITNTLKYAFPEGQKGTVRIKLDKRKDGVLQLEVSDNGIGKTGITHGTGFGGQLISLLTRQLSGSMREEVHNGTHTYFEFNLA